MRAKNRTGRLKAAALCLASHAAMGVALGLAFAFLLIFFPSFGFADLVQKAKDPDATVTLVAGTFATMFGIGAALTGFLLMLEES